MHEKALTDTTKDEIFKQLSYDISHAQTITGIKTMVVPVFVD